MPIDSKAVLHRVAAVLLFSLAVSAFIPSYAHLYGYNVKEWRNQEQNILVQFETSPHTPSVGENSTLSFSVQNLSTGEHLKNFTETVTILYYGNSGSVLVHKYQSDIVRDGDFEKHYVFDKGGTYGVFLRADTPAFINVSRFAVFVSSPEFQVLNLVYLLLPFLIVIGILGGIGFVVARYLYGKK
ncbi:MAG TPA: hypothetical protein VJ792_00310 [Candidatus Nitrosotalea sp.]|nr:hypothetical protein [Candidatus Nitrosotalea sp.]